MSGRSIVSQRPQPMVHSGPRRRENAPELLPRGYPDVGLMKVELGESVNRRDR